MKRVTMLFLLSLLIVLNIPSAALALSMTANITADNHYAFYLGTGNSITNYIGQNELGDSGNPGTYNWSQPETFTFTINPGDYIYVAGWSGDYSDKP